MKTIPDLTHAQRIAYADTTHLGRDRWTELSVHYLPTPTPEGKRFVAQSLGRSRRAGEETRSTSLVTFGLERALELFDDSPIGVAVKAEARDFAETQLGAHGHPSSRADCQPPELESDEAALAWLFGDELSNRARAEALGLGESTMRKQLAGSGSGVRVALLRVAPFLDREAFRAHVAGGQANG